MHPAPSRARRRRSGSTAGALLLAALWAAPVAGERLPVNVFGLDEGLPHDHTRALAFDSDGFLWIGTGAGLARFDGARFVVFGRRDGLAAEQVTALLEESPGRFWVATDEGLFHFDASAGHDARFTPVALPGTLRPALYALAADRGRLWVGGRAGLFVVEGREQPRARRVLGPEVTGTSVRALLRWSDDLWVGSAEGLLRWREGEVIERFATAGSVRALLADGNRLWVGSDGGLAELAPLAEPPLRRALTAPPAVDRVRSLYRDRDGTLWVGAVGRLVRWSAGGVAELRLAQGLPDETVNALAEDPHGNLWLATDIGGLARIVRDGMVSYGREDGLGYAAIGSLFTDREGNVYATPESDDRLSRWDGRGFTVVRPRLPAALAARAKTLRPYGLRDRDGGWWLSTPSFVLRYPPGSFERLDAVAPEVVRRTPEGARAEAHHLFEDSRGDVWVGGGGVTPEGPLARWERATGRWHGYGVADGLPAGTSPHAFAEAPDGALWTGWGNGSVLRLGAEGTTAHGHLEAPIVALAFAPEGALWAITAGDGAWAAAGPGYVRWSRAVPIGDLPSLDIRGLTFDDRGRAYLATTRGVLRWDQGTRSSRHFTTADGLARLATTAAVRDRAGGLWFGTYSGLSRLEPRSAASSPPPPEVRIGSLRVDGVPYPVSPLGARRLSPLSLPPGRHQVEIGFLGLQLAPGTPLAYRIRLEGADDEWREPVTSDRVLLAELGPGAYRFAVQGVGPGGVVGDQAATFAFTIATPLWRRPWFLAFGVVLLGLLLATLHRYRVARLLEVERVRTQIATDLHDDLTASLTRISLLSELARRQVGEPAAAGTLAVIGDLARSLIDATRDLVWAVDPRHDDLESMIVRLRRFVSDLCEAEGIVLGFEIDPRLAGERLDASRRRHLLLVLKEAVHNVVRHASARHLRLMLGLEEGDLVAEVADDGVGFDPAAAPAGRGLANMRARARELGGVLQIATAPGAGTRLALRLPLWRRRRARPGSAASEHEHARPGRHPAG